ncbi:MAG: DUF4430 domain-containing protein [Clostridia bacterium]|nr:DUF4430 domain-containing protein [Clostridia bacterium]
MKKQNLFVRISLVLVLLLLVAAVMIGCGETKENVQCTFTFTATFLDGSTKTEEITTYEATVGDALLELGIVEGEEGDFGLTVYKVYGEEHDFTKDSSYWAIYVDGEYAMSGIDSIRCTDVKEVELRAETF